MGGDKKKFEKYKTYGAYHWDWYGNKWTYKRHVDYLKAWVKEKNTIDIGAGDGFITHALGIKGVDNDPYGITAAAGKGVSIDLGNAYALPYKDEEFDSALMSDTIEHFSKFRRVLREARRVIKSYLYINIPAKEKFVEPDHYHAWTAEEFVKEVEKCGFKLIEEPKFKFNRNRIYFKFQKI